MGRKNLLEFVELSGKTVKPFSGEKWYLSTGALKKDRIDESELERVTYDNKPSRANISVQKGDIAFAKMAETCKTYSFDDNSCDFIISNGFFVVNPKEKAYADFIFHYLMSDDFLNQKNKLATGATQKALTNKGLSEITIPDLSIEIQKKLAELLSKNYDLIRLRNQQIEKLDLLVKSQFIEMFGDPVINEKRWETIPLEDACISIVDCPHSTPNYTNENTGFMCIRTSIVKKNHIRWEEIEYIPEDEFLQRIKRKKPQKGDIIYTREGAILGIAAIIDRDCNVALGQRSMLLSPNTSYCLPEFLSVAMNFDSFLNKVLEGVSGSASPHINVGDIRTYAIMMPPITLQTQFTSFVKAVEAQKSLLQQSLAKLEQNYKSLMQKCFRGEIF